MSTPGYQLLEKLGERAEGSVHRATQERTGQSVSLKTYRRLGQAWLPRLATVTRLGSHPALVGLIDAQLQEQTPFFVSYWMPESLAQWRSRAALEGDLVGRVGHWLTQAARGLSYIHRRGLVHGNLKPENLFVDAEASLRIGDLGFPPSPPTGAASSLLYLAPEQLRDDPLGSEARPGSPSWDLYALGAIFYHLLTGIHPRLSSATVARLAAHPEGQRLRLWTALRRGRLTPLRDLNSDVDLRLALILERCLALDEHHRYRRASDLLDDLALRSREAEHPLDRMAYACRQLAYRLGL